MIVRFLCLEEDAVFYKTLLAHALLQGATVSKDGIYGEMLVPDWQTFLRSVYFAFCQMSRTSDGRFMRRRRIAHVELPDHDDDYRVWYDLSENGKGVQYGRQ